MSPRYCIYLDHPITRRKHFHIATDPEGTVVYKARLLSDVIDALDEMGVREYVLLPVPSETAEDRRLEAILKDPD